MFAQSRTRHSRRRRGIVLVLILAMLSIMALIGVTFATISGQSQVGARFYAQAQAEPEPQAIFDYAIEQLVNDTNNPKSAIRGHSLLRDMYGQDGNNNRYLPHLPAPSGLPLRITNATVNAATGVYTIATNIPTSNNTQAMQVMPSLYGQGFLGWTLRLQQWVLNPNGVPVLQVVPPITQTFQVTFDDATGTFHNLQLSPADLTTPGLILPDTASMYTGTLGPGYTVANIFELDGRYRFAFNGPGMVAGTGFIRPDRPNFLYNRPWNLAGVHDPNSLGAYGYNDPNWTSSNSTIPAPAMDESYDAIDTENMYLGLVMADGSAVVPSFHRPNIIVYDPANATDPAYNDWINYPPNVPNAALLNAAKRAKFLRPRKVDHPASGDSFPDLIPDLTGTPATNPNYGKITYDVDNDGDGVPEAVWVDLGYPVQRDRTGKMFKPLFAFTVIGLNGKLPLNTAGNLQRREPATGNRLGVVTPNPNALSFTYAGVPFTVPGDHASHVGYSPFEINPKFAFADPSVPNDGLAALQSLLVGNPNASPPTSGRYGELNAFNIMTPGGPAPQLPQAGRSYQSDGSGSDYFDANFNVTDFYPGYVQNGPTWTSYPEQGELLDAAGRPQLPSERFRRFVTPQDITGNGLVMEHDQSPETTQALPLPNTTINFGLGYDNFGRVGFFQYFRPPGVPADAVVDSDGDSDILEEDITLNIQNRLHGYEAHRNPAGDTTSTFNPSLFVRDLMARAPFNLVPPSGVADLNKRLPTFDANINSIQVPPTSASPFPTQTVAPYYASNGIYPDGGLALNEDLQTDLYRETAYDDLFTNGDLEWLYRRGDVDGSSLDSRLKRLVPAFDTNPTLRRLFTTETWEPIHHTLDPWNNNFGVPGNTPSVAHSGRKINLNFPLPVSNDYDEPVRQKWCRETYLVLKQVVYPDADWTTWPPTPPTNIPGADATEKAANFAVALAELGQFVVNIVDYRDPDATMTLFQNPDLDVKPAETSPTDTNGNGVIDPAGVQFAASAGAGALEQWGLEYLPVTINEVLAYQFNRYDTNLTPPQQETQRLFIELANLLTEDGDGTTGSGGNASELDLEGWGFLITADDPAATGVPTVTERPNTVTGQLDTQTIKNFFVPVARDPVTNDPTGLTQALEALDLNGLPNQTTDGNNNHYVLANDLPAVTYTNPVMTEPEDEPPLRDDEVPDALVQQLPKYTKGSGDSGYFWIHLLRPANPNSSDMANEPKVVVDSFRFPYYEAGYTIDATTDLYPPDTTNARDLYSVGRSQPLRGAHAIPDSDKFIPAYPYGWSEQTSLQNRTNDNDAFYQYKDPMGNPRTAESSKDIRHSLGIDNRPSENWDYFPFLDRDFASVAELLLVPNCPPGLFTKKFAEDTGLPDPNLMPPGPFRSPYPLLTPPPTITDPDNPTEIPDAPDLQEPHPYPYLPHKFYYGAQDDGTGTNTLIPVRWYQMLEFFEVPSPVFGSIGPVAQGDNGDWLRQEVKPGLLNLNLIYDEEVFFGLLDDPRLNTVVPSTPAPPGFIPQFITSIYPEVHPTTPGAPASSYAMADRGYGGQMKAAFADFLKLRHGGSGFIGTTSGTTYGALWPELPFQGLSVLNITNGLDIYDTILRPARLEKYTAGQAVLPDRTNIPPRRLFQVPDYYDVTDTFDGAVNSPASETGTFNDPTNTTPLPSDHVNLANMNADLFIPGAFTGTPPTRPYGLGGAYLDDGMNKTEVDRRRHPYWRTEMLQKVMNLTTTRTHQYAVWVTVGYFEVVQEGNTQRLATPGTDPYLAIDQLGKEIGKDRGEEVRHKMFFIIDRSRATGFDPSQPGDFRDLVRFSRQIQ